jgi:hypothetical protein
MRDVVYYAQLAIESLVGVFGLRLYEEPRFDVVARIEPAIEVRRYDARLAAEVDETETDEAARGRAFSALFEYIAGANIGRDAGEKIAMTTPVEVATPRAEKIAMTVPVETSRTGPGTRMRFFLPAKYTFESAPRPTDPRVRLVEIPAGSVAVLRFGGRPSDSDIEQRREALLRAIEASRWTAAGDATTLFYDAPFTLPFVRRNEISVPVVPRDAENP